jgi:L-alanine-DL-glutamate epimerase-like enolase superfamily enzyme
LKIAGVSSTVFRHLDSGGAAHADVPDGLDRGMGCIVELQTDDGLTGVAIARTDVSADVARLVTDLLKGEDPRAVTGLWQRMVDARSRHGNADSMNAAISVLDVALWDMKAKANDEPLWKTLGGTRPKVPVHAGGIDASSTDEALFKWYGTMAGTFGCRAGKLKVGRDQRDDLRRLSLMQRALMEHCAEPALMVDADERWTSKQAILNVRGMEDLFDLTWVEAPTHRWDFLGLKRVADAVRAPVCVGNALATVGELLPHFHHHSVNILQVSAESGGITGVLQKADAAFGFELPVVLQASPGNINAHLAGALPYCMSLEVTDPHPVQGLFSSDVRIEDGWAHAGDRPGNGLQVDRAALSAAASAARA